MLELAKKKQRLKPPKKRNRLCWDLSAAFQKRSHVRISCSWNFVSRPIEGRGGKRHDWAAKMNSPVFTPTSLFFSQRLCKFCVIFYFFFFLAALCLTQLFIAAAHSGTRPEEDVSRLTAAVVFVYLCSIFFFFLHFATSLAHHSRGWCWKKKKEKTPVARMRPLLKLSLKFFLPIFRPRPHACGWILFLFFKKKKKALR